MNFEGSTLAPSSPMRAATAKMNTKNSAVATMFSRLALFSYSSSIVSSLSLTSHMAEVL